MCDMCREIPLTDHFPTPQNYLDCLGYIQRLVDGGKFEFAEKTCDTDRVLDENGRWVSDIIIHVIRCRSCGQCFTCSVITDRGGSFRKGR